MCPFCVGRRATGGAVAKGVWPKVAASTLVALLIEGQPLGHALPVVVSSGSEWLVTYRPAALPLYARAAARVGSARRASMLPLLLLSMPARSRPGDALKREACYEPGGLPIRAPPISEGTVRGGGGQSTVVRRARAARLVARGCGVQGPALEPG
jgi:hypothetical protein